MTIVRGIGIALLGLGLAGTGAQAGLFGGKEPEKPAATASPTNVSKRYFLRIQDKATEKELLDLFKDKAIVESEIRAMRMIGEEKKQELGLIDKNLFEQFAMKSDAQYHYDPDTKTVYLLVPKSGAGGTNHAAAASMNSLSNYEQRVHFQFKSDDQIRTFARLAQRKLLIQQVGGTLGYLLQEKGEQLDRIASMLSEKFAMSRDREYEYDTKSMCLFEVIRVPQKGTLMRNDGPSGGR